MVLSLSLSFSLSLCKYLSESHSVMFNSLPPHGLGPVSFLCPWNSPGKNTRVGSVSLLQGIFLTQGLNQDLLHCRQVLYQLSYLHIDSKIKAKPSTLFMDSFVYNIFICEISGRFSTNTCQITKNYVFSLVIILELC